MLSRTTINALNLSENEKAVLKILDLQKLCRTTTKIAVLAKIPRTTADYILRKFARLKIAQKIRVKRHYEWKITASTVDLIAENYAEDDDPDNESRPV